MADDQLNSSTQANAGESTQPDELEALLASLEAGQADGQDQEDQKASKLEGKKILGQFDDEEQAEKAWNKLRSKHSSAINENKALKKELEELRKKSEESSLESMSEEEKFKFLLNKIDSKKTPDEDGDDEGDEGFTEDDVQDFIGSRPELSGAAGKVFKQLADANPEYTLESIYETLMKPLIEDLGGKKIRAVRKPRVEAPLSFDAENFQNLLDRAKKDPAFYEKHKDKIFELAEKLA